MNVFSISTYHMFCIPSQDCSLDIDQALFQPFPSEVVFQQFEPHHTYEFPLALRNNDKVLDGWFHECKSTNGGITDVDME